MMKKDIKSPSQKTSKKHVTFSKFNQIITYDISYEECMDKIYNYAAIKLKIELRKLGLNEDNDPSGILDIEGKSYKEYDLLKYYIKLLKNAQIH